MPPHRAPEWPPLPYEEWKPTHQTLHRYAQVLGKVRMALAPPLNHWWHVTLSVTVRGVSTGPMPAGDVEADIQLDFVDHRLRVLTSDGRGRDFDLREAPAVADFHHRLFAGLQELGVEVTIDPRPFDLGDSAPLHEDREHAAYDAAAVHRFWRVLALSQRALLAFAGRFTGKASPVQLFWHSFDLAYARYSGGRAPVQGADRVTAEAYSHEVIAFGFWAGDERRTPYPAYYSYTAPEPDGLTAHPLDVAGAQWQDTGRGSLAILPYDEVRALQDPQAAIVRFLEAAYRAGAASAGWDVEALRTGADPPG